MKVTVPRGKHVVAVSGGVDSMVLLHLLTKKPHLELIVAHFNHGIRDESIEDEELVRKVAANWQLPFRVGHGHLDKDVSEQKARKARYDFLFSVQRMNNADSVITAHHEDDLIETVFINLIRGTGRRGLTAISSNPRITRPLLGHNKQQLYEYALNNNLNWREDSTNESNIYLRNRLRNRVLPALNDKNKAILIKNIEKVAEYESEINKHIAKLSQNIYTNGEINRSRFATLPSEVGEELVYYWLRQRNVKDFGRNTVCRISQALKTYRANQTLNVKGNLILSLDKKTASFGYAV